LLDAEPPAGAPWDPTAAAARADSPPARTQGRTVSRADVTAYHPSTNTAEARKLQASAVRRIWSTLLDYRDWVSYVYVPIIVPILLLTPYLAVRFYRHSHHLNALVESISQGSPDLDKISQLLDGPLPLWDGEPAEEVPEFGTHSFEGFEVLQDSHILDLRRWNPAEAGKEDSTSLVYGYRRLKVRKTKQNPDNEVLRICLLPTHAKTRVRFPPQELPPTLRVMSVDGPGAGGKSCRFEASIDLRKVRTGATVDVIYEHVSPGNFVTRCEGGTSVEFRHGADTAEATRWVFMPSGREYVSFRVFQLEVGKPETIEQITPVTEFLARDYTVIGYKLLLLKASTGHQVQWSYK
jgi:hypothetical protein